MIFCIFLAASISIAKVNSIFIVEKTCYRRIISGKRLHERFIRHSLPCNSLESCQHQCSIEKHFDCQGFNIRLDLQNVGRGVCELSSINFTYLDASRDFIYDPEFVYYERDRSNESPNCGFLIQNPNLLQPNTIKNEAERRDTIVGGPYYGGDSYGHWSTGFGTTDHGPWGSHGYGSGFYQSNNPSGGSIPSFHSYPSFSYESYNYGRKPFLDNQSQINRITPPSIFQWKGPPLFKNYPNHHDNNYFNLQKNPTYIIIDADAKRVDYEASVNNLKPNQIAVPYYPLHYHGFTTNIPNYQPQQDISRTQTYASQPFLFNSKPNSITYESNYARHFPRPSNVPQNSLVVSINRPFNSEGVISRFPFYSVDSKSFYPQSMFPSSFPTFSSSAYLSSFNKFPHIYSSDSNSNFNSISRNNVNQEVCFQRAHPGYKLNSLSIKSMHDAPTVLDCEIMCSTSSSFKCTGYSFRYSTVNKDPNCLLTDFTSLTRETHLLPDRSCDVYFKMSTCLETNRMSDTECFLKMGSNKAINPSKIVKSFWVRGLSDCELACLNSNFFTCRSFTFRYSPNIIGQAVENCYLSDWPVVELSHLDFVPVDSHEIYERGSYGHGCELNSGPPYIGPQFTNQLPITTHLTHNKEMWNIDETWRHFTVNGWPCRIGSQCKLNSQSGFWSCEIEGGDKAQWDYCCKPQHSCGYSKGYNYPWCYVGEAGPDQWRPCSERYYPDFGNRYPYKPANLLPYSSPGPPRDERPSEIGDTFGPPAFWPVSYFYAESPPNKTYWNDHHHHHYHYHYHPDQIPESLYSLQEQDDQRSIKFKSCSPKFPYPRAIIQKLDLKKELQGEDPKNQMLKEEKKKSLKTLEEHNSDNVFEAEKILLTPPKKNLKKDQKELLNYKFLPINNTEEFSSSTKEFEKIEPINNSSNMKEAIKKVEKLVEENSNENNFKAETKNVT